MTSGNNDPPDSIDPDIVKADGDTLGHQNKDSAALFLDVLKIHEEVIKIHEEISVLAAEYQASRKIKLKTQENIQEYLKNAKCEIAIINTYRRRLTILSTLMSTFSFGVLVTILVVKPEWFNDMEGNYQFYTVVAFITCSVILMSSMLRGVYRSHHERAFGNVLPEHIRAGIKTIED